MRIAGLQKLTLLDFPGKVACTVFTAGCNFRCPFCQNASLVLPERFGVPVGEEELLSFLRRRRGILDGVAITGGEPMLHADLPELLAKIREARPDVIVITGDLIDRNTANVDNAMLFINGAVNIAPVLYVTGNHEAGLGKPYVDLMLRMNKAGVTCLDNSAVSAISEEDVITFAGVRDPAFDWSREDAKIVDEEIKSALDDEGGKHV